MKIQVWQAKEHITRNSMFYSRNGRIFSLYDVIQHMRDKDYTLVATVEADDLDEAYAMTQNVEKAWNTEKPCRSTSVGDVLKVEKEHHRKFHVVAACAFDTFVMFPHDGE